jgi:hypothetical protein
MELTTTVIENLKWEEEGSGNLSAVLENNKIKELKFCVVGCAPEDCFSVTDEKHLRNVHKALTALFGHIDRKNNGAVSTNQ